MGGLTTTLETAKKTILNSQTQIHTASHNIANAENPAYTRQKAVVQTSIPQSAPFGWLGTGATVQKITQMRDEFVEKKLLRNVADESFHSTRESSLSTAGAYLNADGESGIPQGMAEFWDSWDVLSQNPEGLVQRENVYQAAANVADEISRTGADLEQVTADLQEELESNIAPANDLLSVIADYNRQIATYETDARPANDLRDLRFEAMKELSAYVSFDYHEGPNGSVTLTGTGPDQPELVKNWSFEELAVEDVSAETGGKLGGLASSMESVENYRQRLDDFAAELTAQVNGTHAGGAVFDGAPPASAMALDGAFTVDTVDGSNAAEMAGLQNVRFAALGDSTFNEYWQDMEQELYTEQSQAGTKADFQSSLNVELESRRQDLSGVSIDEEMVEILKHQQVFQAAAKIVQRTDQMIQSVINMV